MALEGKGADAVPTLKRNLPDMVGPGGGWRRRLA